MRVVRSKTQQSGLQRSLVRDERRQWIDLETSNEGSQFFHKSIELTVRYASVWRGQNAINRWSSDIGGQHCPELVGQAS